jgi:DNA gyrase/topoisomerase IV subunit A
MRPRGIHSDEIAQNYTHEVGDTLLRLELKFQNELILVHSRPFGTRTAQILKRINRLLRGNIIRV